MKKPTSLKSAFSLVELLVVIAVIAVIAAVAIPNIANITQSADEATKLRNAQQVTSTWNNYVEAYYAANNIPPVATADISTVITGLNTGYVVTNTRLGTTMNFRLPGVTIARTKLEKISVNGPYLVYEPDAGAAAPPAAD